MMSVQDNAYSWKEAYQTFATELVNYKQKFSNYEQFQKRLLDVISPCIASCINYCSKNKLSHKTLDNLSDNINKKTLTEFDPFSIFGLVNLYDKDEYMKYCFKTLCDAFDFKITPPKGFCGVPVPNRGLSIFSRETEFLTTTNEDGVHLRSSNQQILWNLFESAICLANSDIEKNRTNFIKSYDEVQKLPKLKEKLTTGLFWIRPDNYMTVDEKTREFLCNSVSPETSQMLQKTLDGDKYLKFLKKLKEEKVAGNRDFARLSHEAYSASHSATGDKLNESLEMRQIQPQTELITPFNTPINSADGYLLPRNLIFFGAPGTGKSHKLKENVERSENHFIDKDEDGRVRYERVTFYPTYSYAQFVGCYKPVMKAKSDGTSGEEIAYKFVPGPFLRILEKALNNPKNNYCLVIEEINRANAAAVFGDVFQLLDRKDNGESEYEIAVSEDMKKFLEDKGIKKDSLRIPSNMYIWATMNSADQGVFPLDTAFKRRWEFEYVGIDEGADKSSDGKPSPDKWTIVGAEHSYNWNQVRIYINDLLSDNGVNEDKLMGSRFVTGEKDGDNVVVSQNTFTSKVLMYLWEDAARMCRQKIFADGIKTLKELRDNWEKNGIEVFKRYKKNGKDAPQPVDLNKKDGKDLGEEG